MGKLWLLLLCCVLLTSPLIFANDEVHEVVHEEVHEVQEDVHQTCNEKIDDGTMCVGASIDPNLEKRDLAKCLCPKGKNCAAKQLQRFVETAGKSSGIHWQYVCVEEDPNQKYRNSGLNLEDEEETEAPKKKEKTTPAPVA